ncbi:MAG: nucleotidyltransferase [Christensenellaceae bacterium]
MKIAGIIAEYNPFHNGHAYHIQKTRDGFGADYVVCVMSGHFTQRGLPAIADKWTRAKSALCCGADAVLELPFLSAVRSAEGFAYGAVRLLNALGCIDLLSFGSEAGTIDPLADCAQILLEEPDEYKECLAKKLGDGASYASARAHALEACMPSGGSDVLNGSNNILAVEYLKALARVGSRIAPVTIKRLDTEYNSSEPSAKMASASALRSIILKEGYDREYLSRYIPSDALYSSCDGLVDSSSLFPHLAYKLRMMPLEAIRNIFEVAEGLEYKIKEAAKYAKSYEELLDLIGSKRYAKSRISRILLYCLFDITKQTVHATDSSPTYAHLLGFRQESRDLISTIAKRSRIPFITKAAEFIEDAGFSYDLLASDIYALLTKKTAPAGRDFTQKLIVV